MKRTLKLSITSLILLLSVLNFQTLTGKPAVEKYGFFETAFTASGSYENPYLQLTAEAEIKRPDGSKWTIPLFWDGGQTWKLRISPDIKGKWSFIVRSADKGLNGKTGSFKCRKSSLTGSIQPMKGYPHHFEYQNGEPVWFMGETAWALFTDNAEEKHDRQGVEKFLEARASQGFNAVHSMVLSEAGWGNSGGMPWEDLASQKINPGYWQEMDARVKSANQKGLVVGLAIAWGDKNRKVPFSWRMFPDQAARERYARYMAARYSAYKVYYLVSGEWHGEVRTRPSTDPEMKKEFTAIGDALDKAEPHGRMIGIHPMTSGGSVREYNDATWMSFGDYQQNYRYLHARMLESFKFNKPVVNSEYGYHLRDSNGDGVPDKDNSTSLESIRYSSWDIAMTGGYFVTGFGTTYFGGFRDPGPFNIDAAKNDDWELQIGFIKKFFSGLEWWKLESHDEWLTSAASRGEDGKQFNQLAPPETTYWLLSEPGKQYLIYGRGLTDPLKVQLGKNAGDKYRAMLMNPRTGEIRTIAEDQQIDDNYTWNLPDKNDWVLHLVNKSAAGK